MPRVRYLVSPNQGPMRDGEARTPDTADLFHCPVCSYVVFVLSPGRARRRKTWAVGCLLCDFAGISVSAFSAAEEFRRRALAGIRGRAEQGILAFARDLVPAQRAPRLRKRSAQRS